MLTVPRFVLGLIMPVCIGMAGCGADSSTALAPSTTTTTTQPTVTGSLSLIAGSTGGHGYVLDGTGAAARFSGPGPLTVDSAGNVYVIDDTTVRKITPQGVVTTLAGTPGLSGGTDGVGPAARFYFPNAIAVDLEGNVFVRDFDIRKITSQGVVTTLLDETGDIFRPVDSAGNSYAFESHCSRSGKPFFEPCYWTIEKITSAGTRTIFADSAGQALQFGELSEIVIDKDDTAYVVESSFTINKITRDGTITKITGTTPGSRIDRMILDSGGNLYTTDTNMGVVHKITKMGVITLFAGAASVQGSADGSGSSAQFNRPHSISIDASDNLYVADTGNHTVRKISPTGVVTTLAGIGMGRIYGSADGTGAAAQFTNPQGIASDTQGNMYVAETSIHIIRKISPTGIVTTLAGTPGVQGHADGTGTAAQFNWPIDIAVDAAGNLYVTDSGNSTIRKLSPSGVVTTLAGSARQYSTVDGTGAEAQFEKPEGITIDPLGNLYVTDSTAGTIRKITSSGVVTTFAGTPDFRWVAEGMGADGVGAAARFQSPHGITIDRSGNLFVADSGNGSIRKITQDAVVTTLPSTAGKLYGAKGIAVDLTGNLYVTNVAGYGYPIPDASVSTISKVAVDGTITIIAGKAHQQRIELGSLPGSLELPLGITRLDENTFAITSGSSVLKLVIQ